jgi:hypothetical protein
MIRHIFLAVCILAFIPSSKAQFSIGLKGGVHTSLVDDDQNYTLDSEGFEALSIQFNEASYSFHGGLFMQAELGSFIFRPELVYSTNRHSFLIEDIKNMNPPTVLEESYQQLDIPVLFGAKLGFVLFNVGPVGHLHLNSSSELTDLDGYKGKFQEMTYGWQGGIGFDIRKFHLDLRYEGNFNKFGDHITIADTNFNFDNQASRFMASIGYSF